jgi:hypothetical protein
MHATKPFLESQVGDSEGKVGLGRRKLNVRIILTWIFYRI